MNVRKAFATTSAAALMAVTLGAAPAIAAPNNAVGGAAGLVAAVAQVQTGNIDVEVVRVGDVNVAVTNVLNRNRVIRDVLSNNTDFIDALNNNNLTLEDVVHINVVDNVIVVSVL